MKKTVTILLVLIGIAGIAAAQGSIDKEIQYKAAFMIKLPEYVIWPSDHPATHITVVGDSPVYEKLNQLSGFAGDGVEVVIDKVEPGDDLSQAQIVFVATRVAEEVSQICQSLADQPVLIIADDEGLASYGAMLGFYTEEIDSSKKVKFEANLGAIKESGLKVSSRLLKLARVVDPMAEN
jgi:hypothetical protein